MERAQVDTKDCYGLTSLIFVSENGYFEIAKLFLNFGDIKDYYDRAALIYASKRGNVHM